MGGRSMNSYEINVSVHHVVYVEADTLDEAEELALDMFIDEQGMWDDVDFWVISENEIDS